MNISLPESIQVWVESKASKAGKTPDEYVADVLRARQARESDPEHWLREAIADEWGDEPITAETLENYKREIEARLIAGLESGPPIQVNAEFWAERWRVVQERLAARTTAGNQ
jgi:hypothetical protein